MENYISFGEKLTESGRNKVLKYLNDYFQNFEGYYFKFGKYIINHGFQYTIGGEDIKDEFINKLDKESNIEIYEEYRELFNIVLSQTKGYFYIFECNGIYKIGITGNIKSRYKKYVTENPFETKVYKVWELYGNQELETFLKRKYKEKQYKGEWYKFNDDELFYIEEILDGIANIVLEEDFCDESIEINCSFITTIKNKRDYEEMCLYFKNKENGHK